MLGTTRGLQYLSLLILFHLNYGAGGGPDVEDDSGCGFEGPGAASPIDDETGLISSSRRPWAIEIAWKKPPDHVVRAFCDGALITRRHAITPAFCYCKFRVPESLVPNCSSRERKMVSADYLPFLRVHLLGASLSRRRRRDSVVNSHPSKRVASVLLHRSYQDFTGQYDLAVVTMAEPAVAAHGAWPICLPIALTEKLDPNALVTSSGEFRNGRECVTNQYGEAVVQRCLRGIAAVTAAAAAKGKARRSANDARICREDSQPPQHPICRIIGQSKEAQGLNFDKIVVMEEGKDNVTCGYPKRFGKHGWCKTMPDFPEGKKKWGFCLPNCNNGRDNPKSKILEATYSLIPNEECEIDTELLFQPEIELCAAHQFAWPRTGVFTITYKDSGKGSNKTPLPFAKLVAIEQPKSHMGADDFIKPACNSLSSGVTWAYRHDGDGDGDDGSATSKRRAVLVGLTSRRFGCWHRGLGRVHVLTNVHAHLEWILQALEMGNNVVVNQVPVEDASNDTAKLENWSPPETEDLLAAASDVGSSKAGVAARSQRHFNAKAREVEEEQQLAAVNDALDEERQNALLETMQRNFGIYGYDTGLTREKRGAMDPIEEVLALEAGMDQAVRAMSGQNALDKVNKLMVGSFVAVEQADGRSNSNRMRPRSNRLTTWVRLRQQQFDKPEELGAAKGPVIVDAASSESHLKMAHNDAFYNKNGDYKRTTNKPDTSLFKKCGFIHYDPYSSSAGGSGPNEARNAKASETANVRHFVRNRFERPFSVEDDLGPADETVEVQGRNRIVNGEKVLKNRPWIVAIYRGIGFKGAKAEYICTGALVTLKHMVSAAHCFCVPPSKNPIEDEWTDCDSQGQKKLKGKHLQFYSFFPGLLRLDKKKTNEELKAKRIIVHPDHTLEEENHDISIVELKKKLSQNKKIVPICLPGKEPSLDMGLNEVFAAGWGTNAVKADLDDDPPKHKSCMTTQFGSAAFKGCVFESADEGCYQRREPPQDARCPGIMRAVLRQHPRLDKTIIHWGGGREPTKCYLPETHGKHGWCKTRGGDWGFCFSSCNEKAAKPVQKTKELREVSFSRLNNSLCQAATPTFDQSIELCFGHILREPMVGVLTADKGSDDGNKLLLRKITKQTYTGNDPVGLRDTCQGDSGGPYYQYVVDGESSSRKYRGILVGVTSRGAGCAQLGTAGTATNVFQYKSWIKKNVKGGSEDGDGDNDGDSHNLKASADFHVEPVENILLPPPMPSGNFHHNGPPLTAASGGGFRQVNHRSPFLASYKQKQEDSDSSGWYRAPSFPSIDNGEFVVDDDERLDPHYEMTGYEE